VQPAAHRVGEHSERQHVRRARELVNGAGGKPFAGGHLFQ
jgi:hypothetical protein